MSITHISAREQVLFAAIERLEAEKAELLEALQDVIGWVPRGNAWHTNGAIDSVEKARAAIARATNKGEKA